MLPFKDKLEGMKDDTVIIGLLFLEFFLLLILSQILIGMWMIWIHLTREQTDTKELSELDYSWPHAAMTTLAPGVPLAEPCFSIALTTSIPSTTLPNTTCFPSSLRMSREDEYMRQRNLKPAKNVCFHLNACVHVSQWSSPASCPCAEEELGPVGVGPSVSHRQCTFACVFQLEVLISKLLSVDGFASSSIVVGKVSTL